MNPIAILKKLCIGGTWHVGLRDYLVSNKMQYKELQMPNGEWVADPFLFEENGKHYLFCEHYFEKDNRAGISCFEIANGNIGKPNLILKKPYHLSYPCVFKCDGNFYMIPESSANDTIDLYVATEFPLKWVHKKTLLEGKKYVDSTVYFNGNAYYLLSYRNSRDGWILTVFSLDMNYLSLKKLCERTFSNNVGRPAGFLFVEYGKLMRPAQNCSKKYGENIILYQVDRFTSESFDEHELGKITVKDIVYPQKVNRIHTLNRDSRYEVVDVFAEKIDLLHGLKILRRAYLKL